MTLLECRHGCCECGWNEDAPVAPPPPRGLFHCQAEPMGAAMWMIGGGEAVSQGGRSQRAVAVQLPVNMRAGGQAGRCGTGRGGRARCGVEAVESKGRANKPRETTLGLPRVRQYLTLSLVPCPLLIELNWDGAV